jgi:hypothetical protein
MVLLPPNPEEIAHHADENRAGRCRDRCEEIMDSEARQKIRDNPPNDASACARNMELPETLPGGAAVTEYPTVIDEKAQKQGGFGTNRCRGDQRQVEQVAKNVKNGQRARGECQSDDPPPYERSGLELFDQTSRKRWNWRRGLNPRPSDYKIDPTTTLPSYKDLPVLSIG